MAARTSRPVGGWFTVGLANGWAYDAGMSRTPMSFVPFVGGIIAVPWVGTAAVGARARKPVWMTAIAGLLGLGLHLANGGPDVQRDRVAGRRSLPVLLGDSRSRDGAHLALTGATALVVASAPVSGRRSSWLGAAACLGLLAWDRCQASNLRNPGHHPFVLPVLAAGALSAGWLSGAAGSDRH